MSKTLLRLFQNRFKKYEQGGNLSKVRILIAKEAMIAIKEKTLFRFKTVRKLLWTTP
jgi:hypothetical protein